MNLIPIISDLLLRYQKATIPEFGTFLIIKHPAQLNRVTRVLSPPGITVKFDNDLKKDDRLLSGYLTKKLKLSDTASLERINEFVQESIKQLKTKGVITFGGLGTLKLEKTGEYSFTTDEDLLNRIKIFELPKLNITETKSQQVSKPFVPVNALNSANTVNKEKTKKRRLWIPVSIIIIVAVAAGSLYYTGIYSEIKSAAKSIFVSEKGEEREMVFGKRNESDTLITSKDTLEEIISRELEERTNREKALAYKDKTPENVVPNDASRKEESLKPVSSEKRYHIIAGAFLVPNNAERQKSVLEKKGYPALILPKRGDYYMVSLGSYNSNQNATDAMEQLENSLNKELWILKIK